LRNINERKRIEQALFKSEETLRAILAASPVGIGLINNQILDWANKAMYQMLGYAEGSLLGKSARILYLDEEEYEQVSCELYSGTREKGIGQAEVRWVRQDGGAIHCYVQASPLEPSDPAKGFIVAAMDISDRKQAEAHIHTLTQQLMKAQENERRMISRELHDRVAQDLSTMRISIQTIFGDRAAISSEMKRRVSEFSKMLEATIMTVRDLSYELRPPSLDQLGLVRSIFRYCQDFSEKTGLNVEFTSAGLDDLRLDSDIEINLYRLIQEGLNNVWKHAEAHHATVRLVASFPKIILRIEDDGKGFDVKGWRAVAMSKKRMGLESMKERVGLLQGKIEIQSRPLKGTRIFIEVPNKERMSEREEEYSDRR
jgi:PAS domain S-box-containing protein